MLVESHHDREAYQGKNFMLSQGEGRPAKAPRLARNVPYGVHSNPSPLYWIGLDELLEHLGTKSGVRGLGFESQSDVCRMTFR